MEVVSISGWSVDIISTESDYEEAQAVVYYKGCSVGEYELDNATESSLDVRFYDFFKNTYKDKQYEKDCQAWYTFLEDQFGEKLSNKETLATTLFKVEEFIAPNKKELAVMLVDFVLIYSREVTTDEVSGEDLVTYTLDGYTLADDYFYNKAFIKELKSKGLYPIRLNYNMR